ncbi:RAD50-interacting protein 1-like [Tropilaelaps mercedesae]|uniref:RAD50-interacting protein 1-like n=1 Tax=Tropilaelaps mercedesae TaxID=418985 RepID=A0A1V9Y0L0_9ACAR|nr:RAD50-interacting protein 1-like [Tropilaelaps mercedesae]
MSSGAGGGGGIHTGGGSSEVAAVPPQGGHLQPQTMGAEQMKSSSRDEGQAGQTGPQPDVVESATVDELNAEIGSEVKHISRAKQYHESLQAKKKSLQLKMQQAKSNGQADPEQVKGLLNFARDSLSKMELLEDVHCRILSDVSSHLESATQVKKEFDTSLADIQRLLRLRQYLQWIAKIEDISQYIEEAVEGGDDGSAVAYLALLVDAWLKLKTSQCHRLMSFLKQTILYWHNILREKFEKEFDRVLSSMGWPVINSTVAAALSCSQEMFACFESAFLNLYKIQLPHELLLQEKLATSNSCGTLLLPIELMVKPLKKRFLFHFVSKRQTNRVDKPEWYLTQTLTWIQNHAVLVSTAIAKLEVDLPLLLAEDNELLLTHTIEEALMFHAELRDLGYPSRFPCILNALTTDRCFIRWIALEKRFADEKRDKLLSSPSAWTCPYSPEADIEADLEDPFKVPECAENFMLLLNAMTERYRQLENPEHALKFLSLQQILLEDFRVCLLQVLNSRMEAGSLYDICPILNAAHYVVVVLNEWSNQPFFINLLEVCNKLERRRASSTAKEGGSVGASGASGGDSVCSSDATAPTSPESTIDSPSTVVNAPNHRPSEESVFEQVTGLLERLYKDAILTMVDCLLSDIKAKCRSYHREKWFRMPTATSDEPLALTPTAFPMLSLLQCLLSRLHAAMAAPLFAMLWQGLARGLSLYLYEEVILENYFSEGGAQQLAFDLEENLFPLFSPYATGGQPDTFFREVKEACILLNMPRAIAWILQETLRAARLTDVVQGSAALEEQGVTNLSPSQAMHVLSKRNDLSSVQ